MVTRRSDSFVAPCIPTRAVKPPSIPDWVHEIKHDGYRLQVRSVGPVAGLDQGEEPGQPGDGAGAGTER